MSQEDPTKSQSRGSQTACRIYCVNLV